MTAQRPVPDNPGTHTKEDWLWMLEVCSHRCLKCGSTDYIEKDHIIPLYLGGGDTLVNLQPLFRSCNSGKSSECIDYRPHYVRMALEIEYDSDYDNGFDAEGWGD